MDGSTAPLKFDQVEYKTSFEPPAVKKASATAKSSAKGTTAKKSGKAGPSGAMDTKPKRVTPKRGSEFF